MNESAKAPDAKVSVAMNLGSTSDVQAAGAPRYFFQLECIGPEGVKWRENAANVVCNGGKADLLNRYVGGKTAAAGWYFGLFNSAMITQATHALSNMTASEITGYGANRPTQVGFTSNGANASQQATAQYVFTAGTQSAGGLFVADVQGVNGTTGVLYCEATFNSRVVSNGDTLNVTCQLSMA